MLVCHSLSRGDRARNFPPASSRALHSRAIFFFFFFYRRRRASSPSFFSSCPISIFTSAIGHYTPPSCKHEDCRNESLTHLIRLRIHLVDLRHLLWTIFVKPSYIRYERTKRDAAFMPDLQIIKTKMIFSLESVGQ